MKLTDKQMRELDAWIAEHVTMRGTGPYYCGGCRQCVPIEEVTSGGYHDNCHIGGKLDNGIPHYTTDPAAMVQVLKKCAEKLADGTVGIASPMFDESVASTEKRITQGWVVGKIGKPSNIESEADTLEVAVCLFAKQLFEKGTK